MTRMLMPKAKCGNVSPWSSVILRLRIGLCILHIGFCGAKSEIEVRGYTLVEQSLAVFFMMI